MTKKLEQGQNAIHDFNQKKIRIMKFYIIFFIIIAFLMSGVSFFCFIQKKKANLKSLYAISHQLSAEASLTKQVNNLRAIRLAEVAFNIVPKPSSSVQRVLSDASFTTYKRPLYSTKINYENSVTYTSFFPGGDKIIGLSVEGKVELWNLQGKLINCIGKNPISIRHCAFSMNGIAIAVSSKYNVDICDIGGESFAQLKHHSEVMQINFFPNCQKILTVADDNIIRIWNLKGELITKMTGHTDFITNAAISPDNTKILTSSLDNTIILWDSKGSLIKKYFHHKAPVWTAFFSPDGGKFITASNDKHAILQDLNGRILADMKHEKMVTNAIISPTGKHLLTQTGTSVILWSLSGQKLKEWEYKSFDNNVVFSPDGSKILLSNKNSVKMWDLMGKCLAEFTNHHGDVSCTDFSPDGTKILTVYSDNTIKIWNLADQLLIDLYSNGGHFANACLSPKGERALIWSGKKAKILNTITHEAFELKGHRSFILSGIFSPDGTQALTTSVDSAKLWDLKGKLVCKYSISSAPLSSAVFSSDGRKVITISKDNSVILWGEQEKDNQYLNNNLNKNVVDYAVMSPCGKKVLMMWEKVAKIWDLNGRLLSELKGHSDRINRVEFSPEGDRIITVSNDNTAKLWDLQGNILVDFTQHTDDVINATFSSDGKKIVTTSRDNTAKLWDSNGNLLADMNEHRDDVLDAVFTDDDRKIVTISKDGTIKQWYSPNGIIKWLKTSSLPELTEKVRKELEILGINFNS